jgi:hypothetical protein
MPRQSYLVPWVGICFHTVSWRSGPNYPTTNFIASCVGGYSSRIGKDEPLGQLRNLVRAKVSGINGLPSRAAKSTLRGGGVPWTSATKVSNRESKRRNPVLFIATG